MTIVAHKVKFHVRLSNVLRNNFYATEVSLHLCNGSSGNLSQIAYVNNLLNELFKKATIMQVNKCFFVNVIGTAVDQNFSSNLFKISSLEVRLSCKWRNIN